MKIDLKCLNPWIHWLYMKLSDLLVCVKRPGYLQRHQRVCKLGWLIIYVHKKGNRKEWTKHQDIFILSFPWKGYAKCLEERFHEIIELKLKNTQCDFRLDHSITDQIFAIQIISEVFSACIRCLRLLCRPRKSIRPLLSRKAFGSFCRRYSVDGNMPLFTKPLKSYWEVCVRVNNNKLKPFVVSVAFQSPHQGCVLSPFLFIVFIKWIDGQSRVNECDNAGSCKINCLLFANGRGVTCILLTGPPTCTWFFCCYVWSS